MTKSLWFHGIEARIRYLTTSEGGRHSGVASGYRGQFHYDGIDCDGIQYFPEYAANTFVELGIEVRTFVLFPRDRWESVHQRGLQVGKLFEIREGARIVGTGVIDRVAIDEQELAKLFIE